jgi:dinuclear metal center YbgI/SA1388 family protein
MAKSSSEAERGTTCTVGDVVAALDRVAPRNLAESWDNVGLLVGEPQAPCSRAIVCLDVNEALVSRVARKGTQLIVSHHPAVLRPLASLTGATAAERAVLAAVQFQVALAAAHTNYDVAPGGVNDVLASLLGLQDVEPLARCDASGEAKIVVFVPEEALDVVIEALAESGAGAIGRYRECTFRAHGIGTFHGLEGTEPAVGEPGRREEVAELRLEAVAPLALAGQVVTAVRAAHPYEEPAIDVIALENARAGLGIGRFGTLRKPTRAGQLISGIKERLGVAHVRVVGDTAQTVSRMAVVGGSGGRYWQDAMRAGCELLLTGDVSHHQAMDAAAAGMVIADAGHAGTEAPAIPALARSLRSLCPSVSFQTVRASGPFSVR